MVNETITIKSSTGKSKTRRSRKKRKSSTRSKRSQSNGSHKSVRGILRVPGGASRPKRSGSVSAKSGRKHGKDLLMYRGEGSEQLALPRSTLRRAAKERLSATAAHIMYALCLPFDAKPLRIRTLAASTPIGRTALFKNFQVSTVSLGIYQQVDPNSVPYIRHSGMEQAQPLYYGMSTNSLYITTYRNPYLLMSYPAPTGCKVGQSEQDSIFYKYVSGPVADPNWSPMNGFQLPPSTIIADNLYVSQVNITFNSVYWTFTSNGNSNINDRLLSVPALVDGKPLYLPWLDFNLGDIVIPGGPQGIAVSIVLTQFQSIVADSLFVQVERYVPSTLEFYQIAYQAIDAASPGTAVTAFVPLSSSLGIPKEVSSGYYRISLVGTLKTTAIYTESFLETYCTIKSYTSLRTVFVLNQQLPVVGAISTDPLVTSSQTIGSASLITNCTPEMYKGGVVTAIAGNQGSDWSNYVSSQQKMNNLSQETGNFYTGPLAKGVYGYHKPLRLFNFENCVAKDGMGNVYPFYPGIINTPTYTNDSYNVVLLQPPAETSNSNVPSSIFRITTAIIYECQTTSQMFSLDNSHVNAMDVYEVMTLMSDMKSFMENPLHLSNIVKTVTGAVKKGVEWVNQNKSWIVPGLTAIAALF